MLRRRHFPSNTLAKAGINTSQLSSVDPDPIGSGHNALSVTRYRKQGNVHLGDGAPVFAPASIRAGDKVMRDTATLNQGKVQLGDGAPVFAPSPLSASEQVMRDTTRLNER